MYIYTYTLPYIAFETTLAQSRNAFAKSSFAVDDVGEFILNDMLSNVLHSSLTTPCTPSAAEQLATIPSQAASNDKGRLIKLTRTM